jgi:RNA polymerase sigma factor (sigma-70 family)
MPSDAITNELMSHSDALFTFARRFTQDTSTANDLVSETYVKALKSLKTFQPNTNAKAWLFKICRNHFYDLCRKQKSQPTIVDVDGIKNPPISELTSSNPDIWAEENIGKHIGDELLNAIGKIDPHRRELILLCAQGFTYEEMAEITNTTLNTVKTRLKRGRDDTMGYLKNK